MIIRPATPADGAPMLRSIESQPTRGPLQLLYTRRPDAYRSYVRECPGAELLVCEDGGKLVAQGACLPRRFFVDGEEAVVGYATGLHKAPGAPLSIMDLLDEAYRRSTARAFFCSILDDNGAIMRRFGQRWGLRVLSDYRTYLVSPSAIKDRRHDVTCRRARPADGDRLVRFYREAGAGFSYFPVVSRIDEFPDLDVTDFVLCESGGQIVAAGALWDQRAFRQYIVGRYGGVYRLVRRTPWLLRALGFPPLPAPGEVVRAAFLSFVLARDDPAAEWAVMAELAAGAARDFDFLVIGAVPSSTLGMALDRVPGLKIGSHLCAIGYGKTTPDPVPRGPFRFECALL